MLEKFIIIYTFFITLNPTNKLSSWAALDGKYVTGDVTTTGSSIAGVTGDDVETWQPIIQTHNWLSAPSYTTLTSSITPSTSAVTSSSSSSASTGIPKISSLRLKLTDKVHPKHSKYFKQYQPTNSYFAYNHRSGNYSKFHLKPSSTPLSKTLSSSPSSSPSSLSSTYSNTNIRLKPYTLYKQSQHLPHHYPLKHIGNLYPGIAEDVIISHVVPQQQQQEREHQPQPDIDSKATSSHYNLHNHVAADAEFAADVNQFEHQQPPQMQQYSAKRAIHASVTPKIDTFKIYHNNNPTADTILLSNLLNTFATNENLMDSKITNSITQNTVRRNTDNMHVGVDDNNNNNAVDDADDAVGGDDANNGVNLYEKLLLQLPTITFNEVIEFYDNIKDLILSDEDHIDDIYSYADKIDDDDDNDLTKLNSVSGGAIRRASMPTSKAATAKITSLKIKNTATAMASVTSPSSIAVAATSAAAAASAPNIPSRNVPLAADITARSFSWNMPNINGVATLDSSSSSSKLATAPSPPVAGTGRKVKKLKKKFQKFLLPLVLAYKLKFLALIPLLIGGLTLLVGTTGLAGFFFALFTAVMSLKSGGNRSAIVVKKY